MDPIPQVTLAMLGASSLKGQPLRVEPIPKQGVDLPNGFAGFFSVSDALGGSTLVPYFLDGNGATVALMGGALVSGLVPGV